MKKVLIILLAVFMIIGITPVSAEENSFEEGYAEFNEKFTAEDALALVYDGELYDGSWAITKDAIQIGIDIAKQNSYPNNDNSTKSTNSEVWTLVSTETVLPYGVLTGKYKGKYGVGESQTVSFSITLSGKVKTFSLSATASFSTSRTCSGPNGTEMVGSHYATHRYYCSVARGSIVKYVYEVEDLAGFYLRTETKYIVVNKVIDVYGNLAYLDASTGRADYRSVGTSNYRNYGESFWISKVNSEYVWSYISF